MSEFNPARPHYKLPFAGEEYDILGTFGMVEAVENAMRQGIGQTVLALHENRLASHQLAILISAILSSNGHDMTPAEAGNLIFEQVGIAGEDDHKLRLHIFSFLSITLAPPSERAKTAEAMGKMMGSLEAQQASHGESTGKPA